MRIFLAIAIFVVCSSILFAQQTYKEYVEVKLKPDSNFTITDINSLPLAPGSKAENLGSGYVRVQIPKDSAERFAEQGVSIETIRNLVLIEPAITSEIQSSSAISYLYNDSAQRVYLDQPNWKFSYIDFSGFPYSYTVTGIEVHYQVVINGIVSIALTNQDATTVHHLETDATWSVNKDAYTNTFNGQPVAQAWLLQGWDGFYMYGDSYIDYWWIKVYYDTGTNYCQSASNSLAYEHISNVTVGSIDNSSGSTGYANYTNLSTSMNIGSSYPITIENGNGDQYDQCGIWIDWNHDLDFDDDGEAAYQSALGAGPYTANIVPPTNTIVGQTTMRIRIVYTGNNALTPCDWIDFGETEDYTINVADAPVQKYSGGTGAWDNPYLISTPEDMNAISVDSNDWDKFFEMTNDIDMSIFAPDKYKIIAPTYTKPFTGFFSGNGYAIKNFTYIKNTSNAGLFGFVENGAFITNLQIRDANIDIGSKNNVGALASRVLDANITSCSIYNSSIKGNEYIGGLIADNFGKLEYCSTAQINVSGTRNVGGLVATNQQGIITKCWVDANVAADNYVGGMASDNYNIVSECFSTGKVLGRDGGSWANKCAGGLIGKNSGRVVNCFSHSNVTGDSEVGGLCGSNVVYSSGGIIENCFSTGRVSGSSNVGGLVGLPFSGTSGQTINSFWDKETSYQQGSFGGTDLTTANMKSASTYINAHWDLANVWRICDCTDYPQFVWAPRLLGDVACPDGVDFIDYSHFAKQWMTQTLSFDVERYGGDGIVNFYDFAFFAQTWHGDYEQLYQFASQWLNEGAYMDFAPMNYRDGIVDIYDLEIFAYNWLAKLY
ncbi:MAG: GEVED domain-containing protein [Phycisphaerales bacterium]